MLNTNFFQALSASFQRPSMAGVTCGPQGRAAGPRPNQDFCPSNQAGFGYQMLGCSENIGSGFLAFLYGSWGSQNRGGHGHQRECCPPQRHCQDSAPSRDSSSSNSSSSGGQFLANHALAISGASGGNLQSETSYSKGANGTTLERMVVRDASGNVTFSETGVYDPRTGTATFNQTNANGEHAIVRSHAEGNSIVSECEGDGNYSRFVCTNNADGSQDTFSSFKDGTSARTHNNCSTAGPALVNVAYDANSIVNSFTNNRMFQDLDNPLNSYTVDTL